MAIGIDFDNTIACYDDIFYRIALEKELIPLETLRTKEAVRNHLRAIGKEDDWTELQGYVYGARMKDVPPFPGVIDFFAKAVNNGLPVYIISHKSKHPYKGMQYNLHNAAYEWLYFQGFFDKSNIGLGLERVFFEETRERKLNKIADKKCSHFIDDLPEFLLEQKFPDNTKKILFAPNLQLDSFIPHEISVLRSWGEISDYFGIH
ncbi:MAG TPA: haloacid dehalogenase-like hydrolase [Nitrospirota bacterium]|nr:haloacid dehalogenase-like hydrolase [Nitrospirota bacterium]